MIDSIEALQILLLLQRERDRRWSAAAVASQLHLGQALSAKLLARLCSFNLLEVKIASDLFYWFEPRLPHLERGAQALASAYAEDPVAVIRLILARPAEPIREFAEAFRLTKKDDESDG